MNILIYGSPFDPIHDGHLAMLLAAKEALSIDKIILVVTKNPRWKNTTTNVFDRINMVKLATQTYRFIDVSLFEVESAQVVNFSIATVRHFKTVLPNDTLYYLIGGDQVEQFHKWKDASQFAPLIQLVAYPRTATNQDHPNYKKFGIQPLFGPLYPFSSTRIRQGQSLETPLKVIEYILEHELYFIPKLKAFYQPKRFLHVVSTAQVAYAIATANHLSGAKAFLAGIFHDIAKDMREEDSKRLYEDYEPNPLPVEPYALHQVVGTIVAKNEFNLDDEDILEAIRYHTTGKAQMGAIAQIVYASDKIEPTRGYDATSLLDQCKKQYHDGFLAVLKENYRHIQKKQHKITNPLVKECMQYYLGENYGKN